MSKKKDKLIDELTIKVSELQQEIHEREYDRLKVNCIIEDVDHFLTTDLIPKLFCIRQADKRYLNAPVFKGFEELEKSTFFIKTWVIDGRQTLPHHERQGYTKINKYPDRGSYTWGEE